MLTQLGINQLIKELRGEFATKEDFDQFKSEFFDKIDPILKEVLDSRDERTILAEHSKRHEDQIEALEKIHPHGKHLATI